MTPEELAEARTKWDSHWPPDLRNELGELVWQHLIRDSKPGAIRVDCRFVDNNTGDTFLEYTHFVTNAFGKDMLFALNKQAKDCLDRDGAHYVFGFEIAYVDTTGQGERP